MIATSIVCFPLERESNWLKFNINEVEALVAASKIFSDIWLCTYLEHKMFSNKAIFQDFYQHCILVSINGLMRKYDYVHFYSIEFATSNKANQFFRSSKKSRAQGQHFTFGIYRKYGGSRMQHQWVRIQIHPFAAAAHESLLVVSIISNTRNT